MRLSKISTKLFPLLIAAGVFSLSLGVSAQMVQIPFVSLAAGIPSATYNGTTAGSSICSTGNLDSYGDGCLATQATLNNPKAFAMDSLGNAYFAEGASTYLIRVMYQGGSALSAALVAANPTLSFTPTAGHMYSFGSGSATVTTSGAYCNGTSGAKTLDVVGDGCPAEYFVSKPTAVAVDASGNIFLGVSQWPYSGGSVHIIYVGGSAAATLITAHNPTVTSPVVGSVYALSAGANGLSTSDFNSVADIAIDSHENVYVSDNSGTVTTGVTGTLSSTSGNQIKRFVCPACSTTDAGLTGWLTYINSTGNTVGTADGDGAVATSASVSLPSGLLFDPNNNLYIMDSGNDRIRLVYSTAGSKVLPTYDQGVNSNAVVTPVAGNIYTVVGSTTGTSHFVTGILASAFVNISVNNIGLDNAGNLLTSINSGIFRVSASTGIATLLSGYGGSGTYGGANTAPTTGATCNGATGGPTMTNAYDDGCPAIQVTLKGSSSGYHIEVDSSGNFYELDNRNIAGPVAVLQKFSFTGQFGSQAVSTPSSSQMFAYYPTTSAKIYTPNPTIALTSAGESTSEFTDSGVNDLCSTTQTNYQTCVYYVSFTPSLAGARLGSLTLSNSGTTLVTTPLGGVGTGAQISLDPAAQSTIGTGLTPAGVAADQGGNFYIADSSVNKVYKSTAGATPVSFATGFSTPKQIAVGGAGTLYVADSGANRIAAVTTTGTVSTFLATTFTLTNATASTTLSNPSGVAVDLAGNVYVADTGNSRVIKVASNGAISALGFSGLSAPKGLAVDASGDVFVADSGIPGVVELTSAGVQSTITVSPVLSAPVGVSLDAAGNLYIADSGNTNVVLVPTGSSTATTLLGSTTGLTGIAVDSAGDVFIAASGAGGLIKLNRTAGAFAFATTNVDSSSGAETLTLTSTGNANLTTGATLFSGTDTTDFAVVPGTSNACTTNSTLTPGEGCTLSATFTPQSAASLTDTVSFPTSSAGNEGSAQVKLSGTGQLVLGSTTTSLGASSASPVYGTQVTLTATVTGTNLAGNASFTDTTTSTVLCSNVALTSGAATCSVTSLTVGAHSITAVYANDANNNGSTSNSVTVTPTQATPAAISWLPSATSQSYGTAIGTGVLDATESSPAGSIAYTSNISAGGCGTSITSACIMNAGTYTLTATFSPTDTTNYTPQTASITYTVNLATPTVSWTPSATSQTYGAAIGSGVLDASSTSGGSITYTSNLSVGNCGTTVTPSCILGAGTYTLTATSTATSNYNQATSTISYSVTKATPTVSWTPSTTTQNYGTAIGASVLDASVSSPTGSIAYSSNVSVGSCGTTIIASCVLNPGTYTLTANFTPTDTTDYNSAMATTSYTVNKAATTTTVVSSSYSVIPSTSVTLTATVTSGATGTVSFYDNVTTLLGSSVTISNGLATLATTLPVGTDSITAVYSGDSNHATSTSSPISISVAYLIPAVTLSCTPTSVVPGQPTTCTATVTGSGGTSTGTVTFSATSDGASQGTLATTTLNTSGVATYYGLIWGGNDSMTAIYNGNATYGSSVSNAVTLTNFSNTGKLQFNWPFINWAQPVSYGSSSGAWPVTLQNLTGATVTPTISIANSNFVISGSNCGTLTQGATCSINVTFTPTSGGSAKGTTITSALTAATSTSSQNASISVSGTALSSSLIFNWPFLNFTPTVSVGVTSTPWPVTLTNSSGTSTTVNSIGFTGANSGSFALAGDGCTGQTLAPGSSCTYSVVFSPLASDVTTSGTNILSGTMTASGNSGTVSGALSVGGWAAAALGFNWPFVNFQGVSQGATGTNPWPVTVTNYSGQTLTGLTYTLTGGSNYASGAFTLTNTCSTLTAGASCTFDVVPSPQSSQSVGAYSATLVVSGTGSSTFSSYALTVSGVAIAGGYSINWNQDQQNGVSTIDFGPQNTANSQAGPWPITVYNNTSTTETVALTPSLGVFTTDVPTLTIASGGSAVFNLYFTPTANTGYQGTLSIVGGGYSCVINTWGGANK